MLTQDNSTQAATSELMHLSSETTTTPTPEKHGAYVGVIGDWTFLCAPWGGGLGQFRQLSSLKWNECNWNATSGGKFEAFRSQSFHARLNTAKTKHF